jgi:hypothetical protein
LDLREKPRDANLVEAVILSSLQMLRGGFEIVRLEGEDAGPDVCGSIVRDLLEYRLIAGPCDREIPRLQKARTVTGQAFSLRGTGDGERQ